MVFVSTMDISSIFLFFLRAGDIGTDAPPPTELPTPPQAVEPKAPQDEQTITPGDLLAPVN